MIVTLKPGPRGPVVPSELRSAILQHGQCRLKGRLAISSENGNRRIFLGKHYLHISQSYWLFGGHRYRVGHRCVGQPEEIRNEDQSYHMRKPKRTLMRASLSGDGRRGNALIAYKNRQSIQRRPSGGIISFGS